MSVRSFIGPDQLDRLATPSNLRLGRQIVAEGGIEWLSTDPEHLRARIGKVPSAEQARIVELFVDNSRLTWSCTCTRRRDLFCKHCVATAVAELEG